MQHKTIIFKLTSKLLPNIFIVYVICNEDLFTFISIKKKIVSLMYT